MTNKIGYYQQETVTTISEREKNVQDLFDELSTPAYKTFVALQRYFTDLRINNRKRWSLYQRAVHSRDSIRATNVLDITIEMLIEYKGVSKYAQEKRTKFQARKQLKELVEAGVIAKVDNEISDADTYMVNPFYIYIGSKLGDCTWQWCSLTSQEYDFNLMDRVYMVKHYAGLYSGRVFPALDPNMPAKFDQELEAAFPVVVSAQLYDEPIDPISEYEQFKYMTPREQHLHPKFLEYGTRMNDELKQKALSRATLRASKKQAMQPR